MKSILQTYQRRLLNLSSSNKSLLLLRLSKEMHLDVQELDFLNGNAAFTLISKLLSTKEAISLCPYADSRYAPVTPASRRLRQLRRKNELLLEERGSKELYLGWPFVHGMFPDGTLVRGPLLFFPVQLALNAAQEWELKADTAQAARFNGSFLLAYAHFTGVPVAEELMELDVSTLPPDPLEFRTSIYKLLKEHKLAVHVGRDFFADRLKSFHETRKADFEALQKPGKLHLEQEAVLGIFPQAGSYLLSDYEALLEQEELRQMEDLFMQPTAAGIAGANVQAQHTYTIFDIDASQEVALQQVKQGKSLVVQGPPGTGKSQLICNLVSDFTARGKKVLVVSQKRAALDVVQERLNAKGLGAFSSLVHDIHADRRNIYSQLNLQIEQVEEYRRQNLTLNSVYADRAYLEISRGINKCIQKLENFKQALFDTSRCGWSAKELYLQSSLSEPHLPLSPIYQKFTAATVSEFQPRLRQYLQQAVTFERSDFAWKTRHTFKGWGWPERQQLEHILVTLPAAYQQRQQELAQLSGFSFRMDNLPVYTEALPSIAKLRELLQREDVLPLLQVLAQEKIRPKELAKQVKQLHELYLVCPAPDAAIPAAQVDAAKAAAAAYEEEQGQLLKRIRWAFSPDKKVLKRALAWYNWELNEANVGKLQRRLMLRQETEELILAINTSLSYTLRIDDFPSEMLQKVQVVEQALAAYTLLKKLQKAKVLHQKQLAKNDLQAILQALVRSITAFKEEYAAWLQWLPAEQVEQVTIHAGYAATLQETLVQHFEGLVAYDTANAAFTEAEREVVQLLMAEGIATAERSEQLFLNSLHLQWLHDLEQQQPVLRMPSSGEMETVEAELQRLLQEKHQLSQELVLSRLREQTYKNITYNRLGNAVTYRRLQAQVTKKRSMYPIRKLLSLFSEEVLDLVPCWLCSPETVAAVLPLTACFDLVIFDEASQCFAEAGLPAMMRGRQVVVAGDAQQLKPTDVYRARWTSDDAEEEELTAESLLQLCNLYLPNVMLTQHYRSQYPELIDFSNSRFYRGKLELVPHRHNLNAVQPAIRFIKVEGLWQDKANEPEAAEVVALLLELLKAGKEDIGVITFNFHQQQLVLDMLEEQARANGLQLPASVIVKNIENIQGDEKEIIILSVGYAPNEQGRVVAQFGSLSQAGGENRLNVAITRAKQQVLVVSSIYAEDLQVEAATNAGPKLLKEYLQYTRQVSEGNHQPVPRHEPMPGNYTLLKDRLQVQQQTLKQELPFADLAVKQGQQYTGLVLTDDDLYYIQPTVRHHHADLPKLLQERNWPYQKVYSRQFWESPDEVAQRLMHQPQP